MEAAERGHQMWVQVPSQDILVTGSEAEKEDEGITYSPRSKWSLFVSKAIITVIQVYAPTSNAEEAEVEWFYETYNTF